MDIASGLLLFAVIYVMVFFVVLPLRLTTQGEKNEVAHGTPSSAPSEFQLGRKVKIVTLWAVALWLICAGVILSGAITIEDIDWFGRMETSES